MYAQDIHVIRARTRYLNLRLTNASGEPYTMDDGEQVIFGVKKMPCRDGEYVFKKIITPDMLTDDYYPIEIEPGDTQDLVPGLYYYDMGLQQGNAYLPIIPTSKFILDVNVTVMDQGEEE